MSEPALRKRGRRGSPESWSVDAHVGQRVRMRRTLLGMSQERLGEAIGLTFQQVQKYERGANRISAGTLFRLGQVLDVPVSFFFDTYQDHTAPESTPPLTTFHSGTDGVSISRRDARLLRLWRAAPPMIADEILALLSSLSPQIKDAPDGEVKSPPPPLDAGMTPPSSDSRPVVPPRGDGVSPRRPRRRHGAVWDPADIYRAAKPESE